LVSRGLREWPEKKDSNVKRKNPRTTFGGEWGEKGTEVPCKKKGLKSGKLRAKVCRKGGNGFCVGEIESSTWERRIV